MNCKPGEVAFIVRSAAGNEGKMVEVINADVFELPGDLGMRQYGHLWRVRSGSRINSHIGFSYEPGEHICMPDAWLRPIRPGDISDEEVRDLYAPDRSMKDSPPSDTTSPSEKKETV